MRILVLNGPNLNLLGVREPSHYGHATFAQLLTDIRAYCSSKHIDVTCFQSNHEGDLVDIIHHARGFFDGIVFNPGAYTHTSVALLDALASVSIPCVEVHVSKVEEREDFRQISYIRKVCFATISGMGTDGYKLAVDKLLEHHKES